MQYRTLTGSIMTGVGFALVVALANGLSTYLFDGQTISEVSLERFGVE